jgi:RNA polymerase sigma-32 factor
VAPGGSCARDKNAAAAEQLLGSHLRLVIKIARGFGGYGMPLTELVAAGNVGLMRALARFEPERGFRFANVEHQCLGVA